jgi:hypothetical protein
MEVDVEELKLLAAIASPSVSAMALLLAVLSFYVARGAERRARKAESVKELLGEKETVAFAALKLLRDGLPAERKQRELVVDALIQACVFEGSDRARALLFKVIEENRGTSGPGLAAALERIEGIFTRMDEYRFDRDELDLERGKRRIRAVRRVVLGADAAARDLPAPPASSAGG